jgi:hypothetical protein
MTIFGIRTSNDIPNRPPGQRPEPDPSQANNSWTNPFFHFQNFANMPTFQTTAMGGQFTISAGLGLGFIPFLFGGTVSCFASILVRVLKCKVDDDHE